MIFVTNIRYDHETNSGLLRYKENLSVVLDELVYHEDAESFPISKLVKIWDEGFLQEKIFTELKRLSKLGRSLEEAARC